MIIPTAQTLGSRSLVDAVNSLQQAASNSAVAAGSSNSITSEWAIYTNSGAVALDFDSCISLDVGTTNPTVSNTVENGSFTMYNKSVTPTNIDMQVAVKGDNARLQKAIQVLFDLSASFELLNIVTPEMEYKGYNMETVEFSRKAEDGIDMIIFNLGFIEVKEVAAKYGNAKIAKKKPKGKQNGPQSGLSGVKDWLF